MKPPAIPPALWPAVSQAFDQLAPLEPAARAAALASLRQQAADVAPWVERLLAAHDAAPPLTAAGQALVAEALDATESGFVAGQTLGIYRLEAPLGRGGMASVWRARQLEGVPRDVALKLPDRRLEAPEALAARFARERDLLAALEHPHIARLYDAGVDGAGQPFLAMELVPGLPLADHARSQGLTVAARVALFGQVLDAVAFAHGRLVLHRDLKAGNVLVTPEGQVKLLDFGIARLLADGNTPASGAGSAFTPDAAAPEQLAGQPLGVASDVHALGVMLYELLAGQRPYRLDRHAAQPLAEQRAQARVPALAVAKDLAAIVARAMALAPQDRYASVTALADDLARWQAHEPVQARLRQGAGAGYRLRRWLRRQRLPVAAGSAVALALLLGLGTALWQAGQAREQAARAQAVQSLLEGLFDGVSPERLRGQAAGVRSLVLEGSDRAVARLDAQPLLQADLLAASGRLLLELQAEGPAVERLQRAVVLYERLGRAGEEPAIDARFRLAEALGNRGDAAAALREADRVLQLGQALQGPAHRWAMRMAVQRGNALSQAGRAAEALAQFEAVPGLPAPPGVDRPYLQLLALVGEGDALLDLGRYADAARRFEAVLAQAPQVPAFDTSNRLAARYNLNTALGMGGDLGAVVERGRPLVAEAEAHLGPNAALVRNARNQLAQALNIRGHYAEALAQQREVLRRVEATPGSSPDALATQRGTLALILAALGDTDEALPLARDALAVRERLYPQPTAMRESARLWLGHVLLRAGRADEAAQAYALAASHLATLPGHPTSRWADARAGQALAERLRGREAEARALIAQACPVHAGGGPAALGALRCRAHEAWLAAEAAPADAALRQRLAEAMTAYLAAQPPGHVAAAEWLLMQAALERAAGRPRAAAPLEQAGRAAFEQALGRPWRGPLRVLH
jgi:eukaryotic-like serine/threonine-protein kinase